MLPEHCVHLVHVVTNYFQSLSLENVTHNHKRLHCAQFNFRIQRYTPQSQIFKSSRLRGMHYILHTYSNMGHVKPTSRKIYSAVKRAKIFDRELQLSRSKKSLFRQTFLLLIVRPSLDFLKRTDKILQGFFSEELVFKSRSFAFSTKWKDRDDEKC